jgi:hypothetical protein
MNIHEMRPAVILCFLFCSCRCSLDWPASPLAKSFCWQLSVSDWGAGQWRCKRAEYFDGLCWWSHNTGGSIRSVIRHLTVITATSRAWWRESAKLSSYWRVSSLVLQVSGCHCITRTWLNIMGESVVRLADLIRMQLRCPLSLDVACVIWMWRRPAWVLSKNHG